MEIKISYNDRTKYFNFIINSEKLFITEEQIFFILGEFKKDFLSKERIDFILKRSGAKFDIKNKELIINFLFSYKNREIILKNIEEIIENIQKTRKDFPPKGLSTEQIFTAISKINKEFLDISNLFTIDFCKINFKEEDFNIPTNKEWLESEYIKSMRSADILSKDEFHRNKINIFVFTRCSDEYEAEHTFFVMKFGNDYFEIEPAGEASRGYGKTKPDGSRVGLDEMRKLLMMKEILEKNPDAKLFFKMTGLQADRINCSIFTLDFIKSLCFQLRELVKNGVLEPQQLLISRLKLFFPFRMNEELRISTGKEQEGSQIYHEGDIDVMESYCLEFFKVLTQEANIKIEEIKKRNLEPFLEREEIEKIMSNEESYMNVPNYLRLEKKEEFLPPELIVNSQINSMISKSLSLSRQSLEQTTLIDTMDGNKKTLKSIIDQHILKKDIILQTLAEKTIESSNRISKIREGTIGK